jgi:hypothetical protein
MTTKTEQSSVTFEAVCRAYDELVAKNIKPTQRKIIEITGGSFGTIGEHLKRREQHDLSLSQIASLAADPICQMSRHFGEKVWIAATQWAQQNSENELATLKATIKEMENDREEASTYIDGIEAQIRDLRQQLEIANNNVKEFSELVRGLDIEAKDARAKANEGQETIKKLLKEQVEVLKIRASPKRTFTQNSLQPPPATSIHKTEETDQFFLNETNTDY